MKYQQLSIEVGEDDSLDRFRRDDGTISSVVYVHLHNSGIIPGEDFERTHGPTVISNLGKVVEGNIWFDQWRTLDVYGHEKSVRCVTDQWKPRYFDSFAADKSIPCVRCLDLV